MDRIFVTVNSFRYHLLSDMYQECLLRIDLNCRMMLDHSIPWNRRSHFHVPIGIQFRGMRMEMKMMLGMVMKGEN